MTITNALLSTVEEVQGFCREHNVQIADLRFTDVPGTWQHFSVPVTELDEAAFVAGLGFDGSSIRGFQAIEESDMMLVPDLATAFIDPMLKVPTLALICNVRDPILQAPYSRDPRHIAQKAEAYLRSTDVADVSYWGPELEHFIFDDVRFHQDEHSAYYYVDSDEGIWNSGRDSSHNGHPNLGHRPRYKQGYFPTPPMDSLQDVRSECVLNMMACGIDVEVHHHEVATAGQGEIDMRFRSLTRMADQVMVFKYIVKNVARAHGKVATFMPKPLFADNGSGMHVHQSLWKDETNLFFSEDGYALTSELCRHYIGGLFKHGAALMAFLAPTVNSYRRLVPGFEAPVSLVYSQRNRSAAARIPMYTSSPKGKRVEFRPPDPSANPYLGFAAMLMAGLDGIVTQADPGQPIDKDLYDLSPEEAAMVKTLPASLEDALDALERDHEFLLEGGVFTPDIIEHWLTYKRANEVDPMRLRPHPYEFHLYFDA
jgi:glutamine synthetase